MVQNWQKLYCGGRVTVTENVNPDFKKLAESCGIKGLECSSREELPNTIKEMFKTRGPVVTNFVVEKSMCIPMVAPGKALDDMFLFDDWYSVKDRQFSGEA